MHNCFNLFFLFPLQSPQLKPTISQKPQVSPKPRLNDTIEMTLPVDLNTSGLQTWPLKNKVITTDSVKKTAQSELKPNITEPHSHNYNTLPAKTSMLPSASSIVDEVALEEKRLINALKNGVVINEATTPTTTVAAVVTPKTKVREKIVCVTQLECLPCRLERPWLIFGNSVMVD